MKITTTGSIIGNAVNIEITKRALGESVASIIIDGQRVQFYKVIQKVSADGLVSNQALLGNGVTSYIQVDENKVKIVGEVEITKGVVQVDDDANYLYQKTTLRLGQNALGTNDDGLYIGNTAIEDIDVATNFMKFSTTTGTFDLKSTGNIDINNTTNELFFDKNTPANSFLTMNDGQQQIGKVNIRRSIPQYRRENAYSKGELVNLLFEYFVYKANGNIPANTVFSVGTGELQWTQIIDYESAWNYQFNRFFSGNKEAVNNQYLYYDTSFNFKGSYFNGTAYCSTAEEFLGALCQQ